MAPVKGPFVLVRLRSLAVVMVVGMMVVVVMMMMRGTHCLCAWNREGDSGDRGQNESKFPHETFLLLVGFF
jgi:hypothetical protein